MTCSSLTNVAVPFKSQVVIPPETLMELRFRKRALVMFGEKPEEIEGFWRQRYRVAAAQQHTAPGIERPRIEAETQN